MTKRRTSVEKSRDEADLEAVGDLFGSAFGGSEEAETPAEDNPPKGPPNGPPGGPPSRPPSGPPSRPPSGPPSGPPGGLPPTPPTNSPIPPLEEEAADFDDNESDVLEPLAKENEPETVEEEDTIPEDTTIVEEPAIIEEEQIEEEIQVETTPPLSEQKANQPVEELVEEPSIVKAIIPSADRTKASDEEMGRLSAEVTNLRQSLAGAVDIIEEMETPPMPPVVFQDIIVPDHLVVSIARLSRQLNRDGLVRASMGTISMLHPEMPGVMISTKEGVLLARLDERDIVVGRLGEKMPAHAPEDWRLLEVLLASKSLETNGPATCIHAHGPYTTAASCEKDLIVCAPIDYAGKKHIGKIIIVDPDTDNPEDFLRQTAEALKQGGMKCVVIRGHGAFVVGTTLEDAWANAAMLEHSMKIVLLARQANIKV
jgi:ribulose-5-phosphate 4-epimerase/fuculose-1-phosphate aldolase